MTDSVTHIHGSTACTYSLQSHGTSPPPTFRLRHIRTANQTVHSNVRVAYMCPYRGSSLTTLLCSLLSTIRDSPFSLLFSLPSLYQYNPIKTIKTNTQGTLNMLGMAKRVGVSQSCHFTVTSMPAILSLTFSLMSFFPPIPISTLDSFFLKCILSFTSLPASVSASVFVSVHYLISSHCISSANTWSQDVP